MLTVASPRCAEAEVAARAQAVCARRSRRCAPLRRPIRRARVTLVQGLPAAVPVDLVRRPLRLFAEAGRRRGRLPRRAADHRPRASSASTPPRTSDDAALEDYAQRFTRERLRASEFHPDAWPVAVDSRSGRHAGPAAGRGRRQVQLPRARRLHRPDRAHAQDAADRVQGDARRAAAGAGLPRVLAGAAGGLRRQGRLARPRARRAQHRHAGRHDRVGRQEPHRRSVGRVQERARDRRRARDDAERRLALPARRRHARARLREPGAVPELLQPIAMRTPARGGGRAP